MRHTRLTRRLPVLALFLALVGCDTSVVDARQKVQSYLAHQTWQSTGSVPHLEDVKDQLRDYYYSGRYEDEIQEVITLARRYLRMRVKQAAKGEKLAIVFDVDETALSNWTFEERFNFGYDRDAWSAWIAEKAAPPIKPVLRLYRQALENDVAVFFVTGRRTRDCKGTEENLIAVGYTEWEGLTCKPDEYHAASSIPYKMGERQKIAEQGYTIIISVGDQVSDLAGGNAERTFLLPNPFYRVR